MKVRMKKKPLTFRKLKDLLKEYTPQSVNPIVNDLPGGCSADCL